MRKPTLQWLSALLLLFVVSANAQTYTFTPAGASGRLGPDQIQIDAAYTGTSLDGAVTITTQGVQEWMVPATGNYSIETSGAQGGNHLYTVDPEDGGLGARMTGTFALTAGQVLYVVVGQQGGQSNAGSTTNFDNAAPGGGGGSFVWDPTATGLPLMAAGGGSGGSSPGGYAPKDANATADGSNAESLTNGGIAGNGGTANNGGSSYWAGGGAGWLTDGTGGNNTTNYDFNPGTQGAQGGRTPLNGALGGIRWNDGFDDEGGDGGFGGGGGGGSDNMGSGGGGGYSGGGGGRGGTAFATGGGGGSFNGGTDQTNTPAINTGDGNVIITKLCDDLTVTVTPGTSVCSGEMVTITATSANGGTITWDNGITNGVPFTATATTTYTSTSTDPNDCVVTVTINVESPVFTNIGGDGTLANPFQSLLPEEVGSFPTGTYYFNFNGSTFQGELDNDNAGGGWLMILNYVHLAGDNSVLQVRNSDLPLLGASVLGTSEAASASWGHFGNTLAADIDFEEVRFYAQTSRDPGDLIDFTTDYTNVLDYVKTGTGNFSGINNPANYTLGAGHTASIPQNAPNFFSDQGNFALTEFPFWRSGQAHWGIRGLGNRWEVDDFAVNTFSTIHRVWVRGDLSPITPIVSREITVQLDAAGNATVAAADFGITATSNCGTPVQTLSQTDFNCSDIGSNTIQLTATDALGNATSIDVVVIVEDNIAPTLTCLATINADTDTGVCGATVTFADPTITDNCYAAGDITYTFTGAVENFTVPAGVTEIQITASGGKGGDGDGGIGGAGATMTGTFAVTPGDVLDIVVGDAGQQFGNSGGGGAGSGVVFAGNPLIIAGGGGGAAIDAAGYPGIDTPDGGNSSGVGGIAGLGGQKGYRSGDCGWASGGGGFTGDGYGGDGNWDGGALPGTLSGTGAGSSWTNGGAGGADGGCSFTYPNAGAWGLGGGGAGSYGGAGGGGYSGGGGGQYVDPNPANHGGGGAGSFNSGVNQTNTAGANMGPGEVTISYNVGTVTLVQTAGFPSGSVFPVGTTTNTFVVTDSSGNTDTCSFDVIVTDNEAPTTVCAADFTVQLDANGDAAITVADIDNGSTDACGIASTSIDVMDFTCADVGPNTVTLTVTDVNGNSAMCTTIVTVEDNVAPTAVCQPFTVQLDANGDATITGANVDGGSADACGIASLAVSPSTFTCAEVGANTVTLTVTDVNGNSSTCTTTVTVEDNVAPTAVCQNIDVFLDATGNASIVATDVDGGSTDNCAVATTTIDIMDFTCAEVGPNDVTLTVTDVNGNSSTCVAVVTVIDDIDPIISCPTDITTGTDPGVCGRMVTFTDAIASDACGIASVTQTDGLPSGSVFPVGVSTVEFTATDNNGNETVCSFTITVNDTEPAMAVCQDITIQLDATGNISIVAADIDGGSTDNCGVASIDASQTDFTCADVGPNDVTLTVTDDNGNVSTCIAVVTVEDLVAPAVVCQNITVELDPVTGTVTIAGVDVDGGSTDACGIDTYTLDIDTFDCSNIGDNTVVLTVTDVNGNSDTCTAIVTVEDNTTPDLVCMDITVELDENGEAIITPADVIASNDDACGILTTAVDITEFDCSDIGTPVTVQVFSQDASGNLASCMAVVTVVDALAPEVVCPADQTVDPGPGNLFYEIPDYYATGDATATDNCTDPLTIFSQDPAPGTLVPDGTYTITMSATDEYGNEGTCTFELDVVSVLGVGDVANLSTIVMYPNPANEFVRISNPQSLELEEAIIVDLRGRTVGQYDLRTMGSEIRIDISELATASYHVIIKGANGQINKRLLKE